MTSFVEINSLRTYSSWCLTVVFEYGGTSAGVQEFSVAGDWSVEVIDPFLPNKYWKQQIVGESGICLLNSCNS